MPPPFWRLFGVVAGAQGQWKLCSRCLWHFQPAAHHTSPASESAGDFQFDISLHTFSLSKTALHLSKIAFQLDQGKMQTSSFWHLTPFLLLLEAHYHDCMLIVTLLKLAWSKLVLRHQRDVSALSRLCLTFKALISFRRPALAASSNAASFCRALSSDTIFREPLSARVASSSCFRTSFRLSCRRETFELKRFYII